MNRPSNTQSFSPHNQVSDLVVTRHDPVTARAISRLSHGVARLNTSTSPSERKAFRLKSHRSDHGKDLDDIELNQHYVSTEVLRTTQTVSGSKRKWHSFKLNTNMETDESNGFNWFQRIRVPPSENYRMPDEVSRSSQDLEIDSFDSSDRCSSASSMLSVTSSSVSDSNGCHASDADVEDSNIVDKMTSLSRSHSLPVTPSTSGKQRDRISNTNLLPSSTCGGDSSDGFSTVVKMPRLSDCLSTRPNRVTDRGRHNRSAAIGHNFSTQTRNYFSPTGAEFRKSTRLRQSHTIVKSPAGSFSTGNTGLSSPTSKSCNSLPEFADDEQSDFPADEPMPLGNRHCLLRSLTWTVRPARPSKPKSGIPWSGRHRNDLFDADSDLECFVTGQDTMRIRHNKSGCMRNPKK